MILQVLGESLGRFLAGICPRLGVGIESVPVFSFIPMTELVEEGWDEYLEGRML